MSKKQPLKPLHKEINDPKIPKDLESILDERLVEDPNSYLTADESLRMLREKYRISDKFRGVFSEDDSKSFNKHTEEMRKEW